MYSSLVQFQFHAVPIRFRLMLLFLVNTSFTTGHSITGAVQQDLIPPSRVTPLDADKLQRELCFHPDQRKADFVISGVTIGFRLGFDPSAVSLKSGTQNMLSASFHPSVVDQYLLTEL